MSHSPIIPPLEDFEDDVKANLGKANGNVYQRRAGIVGVHDGQILVRLKSKRFILIDYSIVPTEGDIKVAESLPHTTIHHGAGRAKCTKPDGCNKVGVPVLLYDSHPHEPASLYVRSGLCFQCQRDLNESRRAERKRKLVTGPNILYSVGPSEKCFKIDSKTVNLRSDAVILNGMVEGTQRLFERPNAPLGDLAIDLEQSVREALIDTEKMRQIAMPSTEHVSMSTMDRSHHHHHHLHHHHSELDADVMDAAEGLLHPSDPHHHHHHHNPRHPDCEPGSREDVQTLYRKAFQSLHKSIILLSQWKSAWDSTASTLPATINPVPPPPPLPPTAAATASANNTTPHHAPEPAMGDPSLSEAVASAAAVAAAAAADNESGVVSLLMAADRRKDDEESEVGALEAFEV